MKLFISIFLIVNACTSTSVKSIEENEFVVIKPSLIPGAGMGLFAAKDIPKEKMITHYEGKKITRKEYNALHEKSEHWYVFTMPECANQPNYPYLDGNRNHYGSKVNFAPSEINGKPTNIQNVYFLKHCEEPYVRLYAKRNIKKGEELYVSYGGIYNYHFMKFTEVQDFFLKKAGITLKPDEKFTFKD